MSEREKPFTVSDRRHFTPEGQARDDEAAQAEAPAQPGGSSAADPAGDDESSPGAAAAEAETHAPHAGPVEFDQFLLSLGAQAAALLAGAVPDKPAERASALEGARSVIAILEMLRDKTEGRRTSDEDRLLEGLLFELRMAFVERTRAGQP